MGEEIEVHGRIAVGSTVHGRNRYTNDQVAGVVTHLSRSDLNREVTATVRQARPQQGSPAETFIRADDLTPDRVRCRRPATIPDAKHTGGLPQDSGYRCANCGRTIWYIRGGWDGRLTHDAVLSVRFGY